MEARRLISEVDWRAQVEEVLALRAILGEADFQLTARHGPSVEDPDAPPPPPDAYVPLSAEILVHVELPGPSIRLLATPPGGVDVGVGTVGHLPPIRLSVVLFPTYPSADPPAFRLACPWLGRAALGRLCASLDEAWARTRGFSVLYEWVLRLREAWGDLGLPPDGSLRLPHEASWDDAPEADEPVEPEEADEAELDGGDDAEADEGGSGSGPPPAADPRGRCEAAGMSVRALTLELLRFGELEEERRFAEAGLHLCAICFEERPAQAFRRAGGCKHRFCCECLRAHAGARIADGGVEVRCPEPTCGEMLPAPLMRELLGPEAWADFDARALERALQRRVARSRSHFFPRASAGVGRDHPTRPAIWNDLANIFPLD